jgi:hypothetical protein
MWRQAVACAEAGCHTLAEAGRHVHRGRRSRENEAGCRCTPCDTYKHRPLAYHNAAWLSPGGFSPACKETMYIVERETGREPATACLEGRVSHDHRLFGIDRLWEPIERVLAYFTQH